MYSSSFFAGEKGGNLVIIDPEKRELSIKVTFFVHCTSRVACTGSCHSQVLWNEGEMHVSVFQSFFISLVDVPVHVPPVIVCTSYCRTAHLLPHLKGFILSCTSSIRSVTCL